MTVGIDISSIQLSAFDELEIPISTSDEMNRMVQVFKQEAQILSEIQQLRDKQAALTARFWCL